MEKPLYAAFRFFWPGYAYWLDLVYRLTDAGCWRSAYGRLAVLAKLALFPYHRGVHEALFRSCAPTKALFCLFKQKQREQVRPQDRRRNARPATGHRRLGREAMSRRWGHAPRAYATKPRACEPGPPKPLHVHAVRATTLPYLHRVGAQPPRQTAPMPGAHPRVMSRQDGEGYAYASCSPSDSRGNQPEWRPGLRT